MYFSHTDTPKASPIASTNLDEIMEHIRRGGTVDICTHLKVRRVTGKVLQRWERAGYDLFEVRDGSLYIGRGRHYDCIDHCRIILH